MEYSYTREGSIQWWEVYNGGDWGVYQGGEYPMVGSIPGRGIHIPGKGVYNGGEYTRVATISGWGVYNGGGYTWEESIPGRRVYQGGENTMFKEHITTFVKVVNCVRKRQEKPQNFVIRNQIQLWTI